MTHPDRNAAGCQPALAARALDQGWTLCPDPDNRGRADGWFAKPQSGAATAPVPGLIQEVFPEHRGIAWYWCIFRLDRRLAADERVTGAGLTALREWGNSTSGSRLLNGTNHMHIELERKLAAFKGTEASAVFPSGYMANLGVLSALLNEGDYVVMDKLAHASIIDGIKLTGSVLRTFKHQDMESLDKVLAPIPDGASVLIAIDGIYSMDGDFAKLPEIVKIARKYGAKIMIDDAHSTGVAGPNGRGTADHFGMEEVDIVTGTLSKALGCVGGFVAGKKEMVEFIKYNARSFIYSTSLSPSTTASLIAAVDIAEDEKHRRENLWKVTNYLREGLQAQGYHTGPSESPIIPVILDDEASIEFICHQSQRVGSCNVYPVGAITKGRQGKELAGIDGMRALGVRMLTDDGDTTGDPAARAAGGRC